MTTRRERDAQKMKTDILSAANEIAQTEGYEAISIRKIAKKIDYTASLIYHYFPSKEQIVSVLLQQGYGKLIAALTAAQGLEGNAEEKLRTMTRSFLQTALQIPQEFSIVHMDSSPLVLEHTAYLFKGAMEKRLPLHFIAECIKGMHPKRELDEHLLELSAQSIAASTLGLALKLIVEKDLAEEQQQTLITYFCETAVVGMARMGD